MKPNLRKLKVKDKVEVRWIDADGPGDPGWHDEAVIEEWVKQKYIVNDVGYVLEINNDYIALIGGYSEEEDYVAQYHREVKVPRGCLLSVKKLK